MTFLQLSEKLERLAEKLPGPLRKALIREITPLKDIFLRQRAPRLLFLGTSRAEEEKLINALFGCEVAVPDLAEIGTGCWQRFTVANKGTLQCLDARNPSALNRSKSALGSELPDLIIFLKKNEEELPAEACDVAATMIEFIGERHDCQLPVIGVVIGTESNGEGVSPKEVASLEGWLRSRLRLNRSLVQTLPINLEPPQESENPELLKRPVPGSLEALAEAIVSDLPDEAKLEMARLSGVRSAQIHIAKKLTRSFSALSGAIGAQPIPLADFPILTSLQATMVTGIMYVSGREVTMKRAAEFIAALGANISAGLVLREGARALLKLFPGWGNAISGAIASAGTYAIGRAAAAFFIEGVSLPDARKLFVQGKSAIEKRRTGR